MGILLAGLGAYQYLNLRGSLIDTRVSALNGDVAAGRADLLRARPNNRGARPGRAFCTATPATQQAAALDYANAIATASGRTVTVTVFDASQRLVASTGPSRVLLDTSELSKVLNSGNHSTPRVVEASDGERLVIGYPITGTAKPCGVAQVDASMETIDAVLAQERQLLVGSGLAGILVALGAGGLIAGRAMRPLQRLTETADRLAAGDLRARSRLDPRRDEVGSLAHAFDEMAERIEAAFAAQRESEQRTRRFIADASHELRTPITALKGFIDVLRRGAAHDRATLDAALEAMSRDSERMRLLVLDLLALARVDARQSSPPSEALDLNEVVTTVLREDAIHGPENVIQELWSKPLPVRAERAALQTVIRNLLVNARKYAPGARQVWSTNVDGDWAVLRAADDGPGIPAHDLPHVFERFYRGEKMRGREEGGSGLGLSIVQGLVRANGGDVSIESHEGIGTTVTVRIPLSPAVPPSVPPPASI